MTLGWLFVYLVVERLFELTLSGRNRKILQARGGREYHPGSYRALVVLHTLFLLSLVAESHPWRIPFDQGTIAVLIGFILLQVGRYWCMWALGPYWNTRIMVVPGSVPICRGPYRFLRHPNYLIVVLEFIVLPVLLRTPITLVIFFIANLILLRQRVALEEEVLRRETEYTRVFGGG